MQNSLSLCIVFILLTACKPKSQPMSQEEFHERKRDMLELNKTLVKKDQLRIIAYLDREQLELEETKTGLWFGIQKVGEGRSAKGGDIIRFDYTVELLDGTICYNSSTQGPKEFRVGQGGVESGLEEAALMLSRGSQGIFIMPPHLAFGLPGDGDKIPARSTIVYKIEVLSIE